MVNDIVVHPYQISGSLSVSGGVTGSLTLGLKSSDNGSLTVCRLLIGFRQYESVNSDTVSVYLKWLQLVVSN